MRKGKREKDRQNNTHIIIKMKSKKEKEIRHLTGHIHQNYSNTTNIFNLSVLIFSHVHLKLKIFITQCHFLELKYKL